MPHYACANVLWQSIWCGNGWREGSPLWGKMLVLVIAAIAIPLDSTWARCEHLEEAIKQEQQAQENDFRTGMSGILSGSAAILPNCQGYDCVLDTESARHETNLSVLRPRLEGCERAVEGFEQSLREARWERRAHERTR
jgi:hypothetical protein